MPLFKDIVYSRSWVRKLVDALSIITGAWLQLHLINAHLLTLHMSSNKPWRKDVAENLGNCNRFLFLFFFLHIIPRSGELRMQKLKSHLVRTQSLNILPLKPGVGQYIAIRATLTARDFFLSYFYPSSPFTCIFPKTSPFFSLCWPWLTPVPV